MQLIGEFQIADWQESVQEEFDDNSKYSNAAVQQQYSGDIQGTGKLRYQMHYQSDTLATFVGFEKVNAIINGETCTLTFKHDGKFENGIATSQFTIIQASVSKLVGLKGQFESGENCKAQYQIAD